MHRFYDKTCTFSQSAKSLYLFGGICKNTHFKTLLSVSQPLRDLFFKGPKIVLTPHKETLL